MCRHEYTARMIEVPVTAMAGMICEIESSCLQSVLGGSINETTVEITVTTIG